MLKQRDRNTYNDIVQFRFKYNIDYAEYKGDVLFYLFYYVKQIDEGALDIYSKDDFSKEFPSHFRHLCAYNMKNRT